MQTPDPDQTTFVLDADAFDEFVARLDAPPQPSPRLDVLLARPTVFDR